MSQWTVGPITEEWIGAYAAASGDDNPVHRGDPERGVAALVHGALLAALLERAVHAMCQPKAIREIAIRFLSPVSAGAVLEFREGGSRDVAEDGIALQQLRVTARQPGQRICLIADCTIEPGGELLVVAQDV